MTLIATRLLCACGENWVYENVKASFYCGGYTFTATGRTVKEEGWRAVEAAMRRCCRIGSDANHTGGKSGHETRAAEAQELLMTQDPLGKTEKTVMQAFRISLPCIRALSFCQ